MTDAADDTQAIVTEETDWWQAIEHFAYCLDGKAPEDWHAMLQRMASGLPVVVDPNSSLEDFKRYAVCHLIQIFAAGPCPFAETDAEECAELFVRRWLARHFSFFSTAVGLDAISAQIPLCFNFHHLALLPKGSIPTSEAIAGSAQSSSL